MTYEESETLLHKNGTRRRASGKEVPKSLLINRILVIVCLVVLVSVTIVFQLEINGLQGEVLQMSETLKVHEEVIERFNASVTNSDVVARLESLESGLELTRHKLSQQLESTQEDISRELNQTLEHLSQTVAEAESQISEEVDRVKTDVEQYVLTTQDQFSMENSFMVYQLAGTFTLLSCLISMWHMTAHLRKMNQPNVQRRILAILWMSPIYAITSWFSLVFHSAEGYLAIIKDGYEAYIIYQFLSFCIAVLGRGDRDVVVDLLARRADHLTPPFRFCGICELCCSGCRPKPFESSRALSDAILLQCQAFALQFVFFRPLTTTAMVVLDKLQYYGLGDGPTDYRSPQFYLVIVQNLSIFIAFAGLLKFYHAVDKDLSWCRPLAKFLCIKGVVFMTFWQGLAFSVLAETTDVGGQDAAEWAQSAQNFLICLEMLLFSIAHFYCFPTEEWQDGYRVKHSQSSFGDSIALGDFFRDVKLILKSNKDHSVKKKKRPSQETIMEEGHGTSDVEADDRTEVQSSASALSEEENAEHALALALEQSLGAAGNDPDIIEAKRRLLESGILTADFFEHDSGSQQEESSDLDEDSDEVSDLDEDESSTGSSVDEEADDEEEDRTSGPIPTAVEETPFENEDRPPLSVPTTKAEESTTSASSDILRPSFFTTVASIAKEEEPDAATNGSTSKKLF